MHLENESVEKLDKCTSCNVMSHHNMTFTATLSTLNLSCYSLAKLK